MADYGFYRGVYCGESLTEDEFIRLSARASAQLERYKRIYRVTEPEKDSEAMAICAMTDALYYFESAQSGDGPVSSASIGSVSVSYGNLANSVDLSAKGQAQELFRCACLYLDIYRGCG